MKNLVIGLDGLSASGKTTLANSLIQNNKFIFIELSDLYKLIVPYYILLKNNNKCDIIEFLDSIEINYSINCSKIIFKVVNNELSSFIENINFSRKDIYEMVEIESIKYKIYDYLKDLITKLKINYWVIISGREISKIYPNIDYHFMLKADFSDRINRMIIRDKISEESAIENIKIQNRITYIDNKAILINSSRLNKKDIELMVNNVIEFRKLNTKKRKIIFLGAASTGKSTICKKCCECVGEVYYEEYLRKFMEDNKITFSKLKELDSNSFIEIMKNVINYEEKIDNNSKKITFIDSGVLHYALDFDMTENREINEMICNELDRAIIFVCDNNISIEQDEIRPNNQELNFKKSQSMIIDYLKKENIPFFILTGSIEERLNSIKAILNIT